MQKNKFVALRGFTLLELIVVIAIIGILSVIILPSFSNALAKARDGRRVSELKGLQSSLLLYSQQNGGKYPATGYATGTTSTCKGAGCLVADKIENRIAVGATDATYVYVGVGCGATASGPACDAYQLSTELEASNEALQGDSDYVDMTTTFPGITTGGSDGTPLVGGGAKEVCTDHASTIKSGDSAADCRFDLIP